MRARIDDAVALGRTVLDRFRETGVTFLAAAIAYYAFVSLIPLLLLVVAAGSAVGGEVLADRIAGATGDALTPSGQELVRDALTDSEGRDGATVVGFAVLVWGSLRSVRGLDRAFSRVYGVDEQSLVAGVVDAAVALSAVGIGVAAVVAVGAAIVLVPGVTVAGLGSFALLLALVVVFFPLYYLLPGPEVGVREALPGAVAAAAGWTALGTLFGLYTDAAGGYALYGLLGGVLLLLTWFYFGATLLLFGATLNAVLADAPARPPERENRQRQGSGGRDPR